MSTQTVIVLTFAFAAIGSVYAWPALYSITEIETVSTNRSAYTFVVEPDIVNKLLTIANTNVTVTNSTTLEDVPLPLLAQDLSGGLNILIGSIYYPGGLSCGDDTGTPSCDIKRPAGVEWDIVCQDADDALNCYLKCDELFCADMTHGTADCTGPCPLAEMQMEFTDFGPGIRGQIVTVSFYNATLSRNSTASINFLEIAVPEPPAVEYVDQVVMMNLLNFLQRIGSSFSPNITFPKQFNVTTPVTIVESPENGLTNILGDIAGALGLCPGCSGRISSVAGATRDLADSVIILTNELDSSFSRLENVLLTIVRMQAEFEKMTQKAIQTLVAAIQTEEYLREINDDIISKTLLASSLYTQWGIAKIQASMMLSTIFDIMNPQVSTPPMALFVALSAEGCIPDGPAAWGSQISKTLSTGPDGETYVSFTVYCGTEELSPPTYRFAAYPLLASVYTESGKTGVVVRNPAPMPENQLNLYYREMNTSCLMICGASPSGCNAPVIYSGGTGHYCFPDTVSMFNLTYGIDNVFTTSGVADVPTFPNELSTVVTYYTDGDLGGDIVFKAFSGVNVCTNITGDLNIVCATIDTTCPSALCIVNETCACNYDGRGQSYGPGITSDWEDTFRSLVFNLNIPAVFAFNASNSFLQLANQASYLFFWARDYSQLEDDIKGIKPNLTEARDLAESAREKANDAMDEAKCSMWTFWECDWWKSVLYVLLVCLLVWLLAKMCTITGLNSPRGQVLKLAIIAGVLSVAMSNPIVPGHSSHAIPLIPPSLITNLNADRVNCNALHHSSTECTTRDKTEAGMEMFTWLVVVFCSCYWSLIFFTTAINQAAEGVVLQRAKKGFVAGSLPSASKVMAAGALAYGMSNQGVDATRLSHQCTIDERQLCTGSDNLCINLLIVCSFVGYLLFIRSLGYGGISITKIYVGAVKLFRGWYASIILCLVGLVGRSEAAAIDISDNCSLTQFTDCNSLETFVLTGVWFAFLFGIFWVCFYLLRCSSAMFGCMSWMNPWKKSQAAASNVPNIHITLNGSSFPVSSIVTSKGE